MRQPVARLVVGIDDTIGIDIRQRTRRTFIRSRIICRRGLALCHLLGKIAGGLIGHLDRRAAVIGADAFVA